MLAGEDVAGAPHIGGKLVYFVEWAVDHGLNDAALAQVCDHEIIRRTGGVGGQAEVYASDPKAFVFEPFHQMAADETTSAANKSSPYQESLTSR